jgi:hypothetical protein
MLERLSLCAPPPAPPPPHLTATLAPEATVQECVMKLYSQSVGAGDR